MATSIRAARFTDADAMVRLSLAARSEAYTNLLQGDAKTRFIKDHHYTPNRTAAFAHSLEKYHNNPETHRAYVALSEAGEVIGYIKATLSPDSVYISNLYVHPSAQGQGAGGALIESINDIAKGRRLILDVARDNHTATAFYVRRGFIQVESSAKSYYALPMIRMQKG